MNLITNIDDVRARIMELESATVFDDRAWQMVLADLRAAGRVSALADAQRRMETAKGNAQGVGGVDVAHGEDRSVVLRWESKGHKIWDVDGKHVETWNDYDHCLRCGRPLSSPHSRTRGYGAECEKYNFPTGPVIALRVAVETEVWR